ncbi:hypothetical protein VKT23_011814 [Stygiomarasmius scandens]|uniref:Helicase ATP-binding domain-containing protein n=1 Tax=Marasmiellus scandens TaxID=2682957 RepID=A0ABR1JAQ8_9AGAR
MDDFTDEFGDYRYMVRSISFENVPTAHQFSQSKWQVASSSQFEDLLSEQSPAFQPPNDSRDDIRNKIAILHVKRREIKSMTEQELKTIDDRLTALGDLLRLRPMTSQETDDITVEDGTRIDYVSTAFDWSTRMKTELARTFKIEDFKSCQLGTCNAVMAGRNVLCVMPTGGGKSLTYQLPAILSPGITLVISPLVSLIQDQIQNLKNIHGAWTLLIT